MNIYIGAVNFDDSTTIILTIVALSLIYFLKKDK